MGLLNKYGVPTPKGSVATTVSQSYDIAKKYGPQVVVKAQVLAGGRGQGRFDSGFQGGVRLVTSYVH